ncbi:MAG: hypothetical protein Q8R47_03210 [Nanoarchaeota archaeon]|nr:hypothetical protein [Nanoarchaeota archaeon]
MAAVAQQQAGNLNYEVIKANTYAQGVAKLRELGEQPKTFKENIEARVVAYENSDKTLFDTWLESCTAVVNKKMSTRFQIVSLSTELMSIPANFNKSFLPVDYDTVQGIELDSSNQKYDQGLTKDEVMDHAGWLLAVEADAPLLKTYRDIVFAELGNPKTAMRFYVRQNNGQDELRALFVNDLDYNSNAGGGGNLNYSGSFLRGSPVVRAKKSGSAYRNPAMTEERRLEGKILEALAPFDQLKSPATTKLYDDLKQKALQELKKLYHG